MHLAEVKGSSCEVVPVFRLFRLRHAFTNTHAGFIQWGSFGQPVCVFLVHHAIGSQQRAKVGTFLATGIFLRMRMLEF